MASNGRQDQTIPSLGRYWDEVVQGRPADSGDLDPALAATVRQLHARDDALGADPTFAARLLADLEDHMLTMPLGRTHGIERSPRQPGAPIGQDTDRSMRGVRLPLRSSLTPIASAVLVVVALATAYLAGGLSRSAQPNEPPATLPALMAPATPDPSEPTIETLLDMTTDALPAGHAIVAVDRWTLKPSATALTLPDRGGLVLLAVESGAITATAAGSEQHLAAGDTATLSNQEVALRATGPTGAVALLVYVISGFNDIPNTYVLTQDPIAHTDEFVISSSADALPGGAARFVLERLTLPPGSALPPQEASPLVWTEVREGAVGLTLEGEHLPFRWKSGAERTFRPGQILPALQPGTLMTLRNAAADPLVLYRLTLTPRGAGGAATGTPVP